jgi:hypothetical protein
MVKSVEGIYRNGKVELVEPLTEAEAHASWLLGSILPNLSIFVKEGSTNLRRPTCAAG